MPAPKHYQCAVIGNWHLAFVTAACLASLGRRTALVNPAGNPAWTSFPTPPVTEPGLPEMIAAARAQGTLDYANGVTKDWTADLGWLAIDTPVNERDEADTSSLIEAARQFCQAQGTDPIFAISSQVPLGFCAQLEKDTGLRVAYIPENLRLGRGIETFLRADRTVIGAALSATREAVKKFLDGLTTQFLLCDLATSEMVKHATNAFLATSISFANELARLGETMGVDNQCVGQALKFDGRIGKQAYVAPGLGFAGGTLPRDLRILQSLGKGKHRPTPLVDAVLAINESTSDALTDGLAAHLGGFAGKNILLVGYTYKAETDTLRRSLSLELAAKLSPQGANIWGFDPVMNAKSAELPKTIRHFAAWGDVPSTPDAVVVMTPRKEFNELDWAALKAKGPARAGMVPLVFDARNVLTPARVLGAGFAYKALWQPVTLPS